MSIPQMFEPQMLHVATIFSTSRCHSVSVRLSVSILFMFPFQSEPDAAAGKSQGQKIPCETLFVFFCMPTKSWSRFTVANRATPFRMNLRLELELVSPSLLHALVFVPEVLNESLLLTTLVLAC